MAWVVVQREGGDVWPRLPTLKLNSPSAGRSRKSPDRVSVGKLAAMLNDRTGDVSGRLRSDEEILPRTRKHPNSISLSASRSPGYACLSWKFILAVELTVVE